MIYQNLFKPIFDLFFSVLILILLFPVIVVLWLLVFMKLGSPVLFSQVRPGKNERLFKLYKFRTMTWQLDSKGELLPDADRLNSFGKFLRKTSLDELPQLFNVIKGDISLVGPRPLLVEYLPLYNDFQKKRHLVKPGITGLAQVNGRNAIPWEEKFTYDIHYVENISFFLDLKIIIKTLFKVLKRSGVNDERGTTMDKFKGSNG